MRDIYLGLGSNIGDKRAYLEWALKHLKESMTVLRVSSFYETAPIGYLDQNWFLNCAIEVDADQDPHTLAGLLLGLECNMGRRRETPGGPRTIDIDILLYASTIIEEESLQIPHPRLQERRFVLEPLTELCPHFVHPVLGVTVADLTRELGTTQEIHQLA